MHVEFAQGKGDIHKLDKEKDGPKNALFSPSGNISINLLTV